MQLQAKECRSEDILLGSACRIVENQYVLSFGRITANKLNGISPQNPVLTFLKKQAPARSQSDAGIVIGAIG